MFVKCVKERSELAKSKGLCFLCLRQGHVASAKNLLDIGLVRSLMPQFSILNLSGTRIRIRKKAKRQKKRSKK
jgi:hypothetical protein